MTTLGDRMKGYEKAYDASIIGRVPVVVRVDGKGFFYLCFFLNLF